MDKNQGYEIIQVVMLENGRGFALGHNPAAPSPYVTWACYDDRDGQRQYEWGHYGIDRAALEQDFAARVQEYQRLYKVGMGGYTKGSCKVGGFMQYLWDRQLLVPCYLFECNYKERHDGRCVLLSVL